MTVPLLLSRSTDWTSTGDSDHRYPNIRQTLTDKSELLRRTFGKINEAPRNKRPTVIYPN